VIEAEVLADSAYLDIPLAGLSTTSSSATTNLSRARSPEASVPLAPHSLPGRHALRWQNTSRQVKIVMAAMPFLIWMAVRPTIQQLPQALQALTNVLPFPS